jgi:hypothetical protein
VNTRRYHHPHQKTLQTCVVSHIYNNLKCNN